MVKFTPLTVLIGDNGSGKSSLVEGLQTFQRIVTDGLDEAMNVWRGYENIRHGAAPQGTVKRAKNKKYQEGAIEFCLSHRVAIDSDTSNSQSPLSPAEIGMCPGRR